MARPQGYRRARAVLRAERAGDGLRVRTLSTLDLERQFGSDGATWLDRELVADSPTPLAEAGFGREVKDARWTKKHERSYYGYKNHIGVDRRYKFVRRYVVGDASVHDSQKLEDILDMSNTASDVRAKRAKGSVKWSLMEWRAEGDSANRSQEIEEKLSRRGLKSRIHRRAYRNGELSEAQKAANKTRSKVLARVEHVFDDQKNGTGAGIVRTVGIIRARCKIGMTNLAYNMRRFICLERMATATG